ncbi:glucose-6-phosphate isomerase [Mycoplasma tauri]|uniref:glucose-6-phosphate isomerase n=1 Tax=Mycoplasma tauri TaxID=547987 RepID=UPI001CC1504F|nr:glucose-6-phosphate isomerase [Mycoplasma tauri]MBZ4204119.1 glucose-6-phosphate isomerase [Mycoplasma tauri]
MNIVKVDITNALSSAKILEYQEKVNKIHENIMNKNVLEKDWLGWLDLPNKVFNSEFDQMQEIAKMWKLQNIETLVVIGIGGSYLGAKAGYEFIFDKYSLKKPDIELVFAGTSLSSEELVKLLKYVENKKFAINVISKSGTTLEPSIAFREFRKLLESKVGVKHAQNLIVATTDAKKGVLYDLATQKGYKKLIIPDDVGGRFSVLTPVGLFPFICAGLNVKELVKGAQKANNEADVKNILENPAYLYATTRHILSKKYDVELMCTYEPKLSFLAEWWKQLFAESEGKDNKGLWPVCSTYTSDLHSIGQMVQEGKPILFETILVVKEPIYDILFESEKEDIDKLNYLDGKSLHSVNLSAFKGTLEAHSKVGNIPNIVLEINKLDEFSLGYLFQFFERALTISAYLLDVNPFNQPGVEIYKASMFKLLKKGK